MTEPQPCLFEWNPGMWPFAATCVQDKGHHGNHRTKTGKEATPDGKPVKANHQSNYEGRHRAKGRK